MAKDEVRFEGEIGTPIYQIEEADGYFSGDKTLEQTAAIMQKRAMIYMSKEKKDF